MIRWINNTLGTAAFEDPATAGHEVLDVRSLVDGPANGVAALRERIEAGLTMLQKSGRLIVCCDYGISRSNTIAAAILARREGISFDEAFATTQLQTGEVRMDYGIVQTVRATFDAPNSQPAVAGRVLVTGGTGFLGQWLNRIAGDRFEFVSHRSKDIDLVASPFGLDAVVRKHRPDTIIHLANPRIYNTHEVVGQSLAMLRNVADVCHQHGVFLVWPSSWVVFSGRKNEGEIVIGDDVSPMPYGNYAMSKALSENMLDYLSKAGHIRACILRMTPIYGKGSSLPRFLFRTAEACLAGTPVTTHCYRNGRPKLQLLHASDAAQALALAAAKRPEGKFNIGSMEARTTQDLARIIAEVLGTPFESQEIQLQASVANITLDTTKARNVLQWSPKMNLKEGFEEMFLSQ
ncbi:NAD-dependent epimerase/dehydratase family protein [Prosthecobacter sp.]|jgi:nucleoside-diphosphate-sugar epimerase|uniref:NAD-dependent epimerase/dehydratase family protein n=1 Tax=Prosthecobacter sp. TaxID=1965333 RepID=UPI0037CC49CB